MGPPDPTSKHHLESPTAIKNSAKIVSICPNTRSVQLQSPSFSTRRLQIIPAPNPRHQAKLGQSRHPQFLYWTSLSPLQIIELLKLKKIQTEKSSTKKPNTLRDCNTHRVINAHALRLRTKTNTQSTPSILHDRKPRSNTGYCVLLLKY